MGGVRVPGRVRVRAHLPPAFQKSAPARTRARAQNPPTTHAGLVHLITAEVEELIGGLRSNLCQNCLNGIEGHGLAICIWHGREGVVVGVAAVRRGAQGRVLEAHGGGVARGVKLGHHAHAAGAGVLHNSANVAQRVALAGAPGAVPQVGHRHGLERPKWAGDGGGRKGREKRVGVVRGGLGGAGGREGPRKRTRIA